MELSIVILHYQVSDVLRKCLQSLDCFVKDISYEVLVVDNASPDDSWKVLIHEFPNIQFISNAENLGFAKGNNVGIKKAKGEYLLLLNPDTELESDDLRKVLDFAKSKPNFGCLGVRMHDGSGAFLPESKRAVPGIMNSFGKLFFTFGMSKSKSYYRDDLQEMDIALVEVVTGAFLLCKRDRYWEVGGLDEAYFMYGEDIDLCNSFLNKGYQNWYYGAFSILHIKGESTQKDEVYLDRFYGAMQIFIDKYYRQKKLQHFILSYGLRVKHFLEKRKLH